MSRTALMKGAVFLAGLCIIGCAGNSPLQTITSDTILLRTWNGYRHSFIHPTGRVLRPQNDDTVSEGQAYAMLRAVWMDDQKTFDRCYRWTEQNLSRAGQKADSLLAWHWKDGKVVDWMPASDADIDYALALLLASSRWGKSQSKNMPDYGERAQRLMADILNYATFREPDGRLYLTPWLIKEHTASAPLPQNPSYYSPAHFRVFYTFSGDLRWMELVDTAYWLLDNLGRTFAGQKGVGLIPDWCGIDMKGTFVQLENKNPNFGWEAVRIPFRIMLDQLWFNSPQAKAFLNGPLSEFVFAQWQVHQTVYCEYRYDGVAIRPYENPLFYSAYYCLLYSSANTRAEELLKKSQSFIKKSNQRARYFEEGASKKGITDPNAINPFVNGKENK